LFVHVVLSIKSVCSGRFARRLRGSPRNRRR